jgi:hypothetical protein
MDQELLDIQALQQQEDIKALQRQKELSEIEALQQQENIQAPVAEPVVQETVAEPVVQETAFVPRFQGDSQFQQDMVARNLPAEVTQTDAALVEAQVEPQITGENYNAKGFLAELQRGVTPEDLVTLMYEGGTNLLEVDGEPYDFAADVEKNVPPQEIMDYLLTGETVRDVGAVTSTVMGVNTGITNFAGIPFDLANWIARKLEQGGRAGINAVLGTDLSLDPEDMIGSFAASEGGYPLGSVGLRKNLRTVGIDIPDSKREIPEEYRSLYQGGRSVGENILPAVALYKLAIINAGKIASNPNMHPFVAQMANNPAAFARGEAVAILGGAIGAGTAESLAPDNPYWAMGGEIIGAVGISLVPAAAKATYNVTPLGMATRGVKNIFSGLSTEATRKAAGQEFLISIDAAKAELLEKARVATNEGREADATALKTEAESYEVKAVLKSLGELKQSQGFASLPAGTGTDNAGLLGIQNSLMQSSEKYGTAVNKQIGEALAGMWTLSSQLLKNEGTRRVGEIMQARYIQNILQKEMMDKSQAIQDILKTIPKGDMEAASLAVQSILREGKTNLRKAETFWWDRINKATLVDVSEVAKSIRAQQAKMPEGANVASGEANTVLSNLLARAEAGEALSAGEILSQRSYFLDLAREAGGNSQFKAADRYDEIAGSLIDVLNAIDGPDKDVIDMARKFSLRLNETYNRYWIKDTLASASGGGTVKDPRLTLESATSGSAAQTNLNLRDAQDASDLTDAASVGTERQQMLDLEIAGAKNAADNVETTSASAGKATVPSDTPPSMLDALTQFRQAFYESPSAMDPKDVPTSSEARVIEDATGNITYESTSPGVNRDSSNFPGPDGPRRPDAASQRRDAEQGRRAKTFEEFPDEGIYTLDNEEIYGQLMPLPEGMSLGADMNAAQSVALQNMIRNLADSADRSGIPTSEALNRFLTDNAELVERFPAIKTRAVQLVQAQEDAAILVANVDKFSTTEKFNNSVAKVFASDNPSQGFTQLAEDIRSAAVRQGEDPTEALDQLRASTFDMMLTSATKGDDLDFVSLSNQLFAPLDTASTGTSRMDIMIQNGLMDNDTAEAVASLMFESIRIKKSTAEPVQFNQIMQDSEMMINNIARLAGANVGVLFGKGNASLQAASIGSAFMKNLVDRLPRKRKREQMEFLMLNPNMLRDYISKNPTIQLRATDTIKAGLGNIQARFKEKGIIGAPLSYIWDGTKYVASGTFNTATKPRVATVGALEGDGEVDPNNLPSSLDQQMRQALPQ